MTLPTFLGIGVAKAGTTWLTELLATHSQVYLPTKLKDIRFFNYYYDKGIDWYQSFFPSAEDAANYKAIGEFTAHYLYNEDTPQRIAKDLIDPALLLMLRNPMDRLWSNYLHVSRLRNYQDSFENFIEDYPAIYKHSFYSEPLKRYLLLFGPDQLLTLIYEDVFKDIEVTRNLVAEHLNIDPLLFPPEAGSKVVNKGFIPRNRTLYALIARGASATQTRNMYWPVYMAKKMGIKRLISSKGEEPRSMNSETRQRLRNEFADDISEVEVLLQKDLSPWRV